MSTLVDQISAANAPILQAADATIAGLQSAVTAAQADAADKATALVDANQAVVLANSAKDAAARQSQADLAARDATITQLQAAAQARPAVVPASIVTVGPTYIPHGDIAQIAPLLHKDGLQILLTPNAIYTAAANTLEMLGKGASLVGQNNTLNITSGHTAFAAEAPDCSISGFTSITGNALFLRVGMTAGAPRFTLRGCYGTNWALVTVGSNSPGCRLIDCGGKTQKATAYIAGDDCQVINFAGDGSYDEHCLRIDGDGGPASPARTSILGGHFVTLANKEAMAIRLARDFRLFDAMFHGPLLLAQGAGAAPPVPYVTGTIQNISSDWNGGAPGAQLDLRTGSQIVLLPSKFSVTNPKQDRVLYGPGSTLTTIGQHQLVLARGLTGGLFQGGGGTLAGQQDQTIISFAA